MKICSAIFCQHISCESTERLSLKVERGLGDWDVGLGDGGREHARELKDVGPRDWRT